MHAQIIFIILMGCNTTPRKDLGILKRKQTEQFSFA